MGFSQADAESALLLTSPWDIKDGNHNGGDHADDADGGEGGLSPALAQALDWLMAREQAGGLDDDDDGGGGGGGGGGGDDGGHSDEGDDDHNDDDGGDGGSGGGGEGRGFDKGCGGYSRAAGMESCVDDAGRSDASVKASVAASGGQSTPGAPASAGRSPLRANAAAKAVATAAGAGSSVGKICVVCADELTSSDAGGGSGGAGSADEFERGFGNDGGGGSGGRKGPTGVIGGDDDDDGGAGAWGARDTPAAARAATVAATGSTAVVIPGCGHALCAECCYGWLKSNILSGKLDGDAMRCPLARVRLASRRFRADTSNSIVAPWKGGEEATTPGMCLVGHGS